MSGNHSTTDSDSLGAGTATPPGRDKFDAWLDAKTAPELEDLLTAAERARDEAADDRDSLTERVAELVTEGNELREERDKARAALRMLASIVHADVLVMEAAAIEMRKGDEHAAMQWILNAMPDQRDGEPGTEWNGRETAREWFDRQPAVQNEQPGPAVVTAGTQHLAAAITRLAIPDEES